MPELKPHETTEDCKQEFLKRFDQETSQGERWMAAIFRVEHTPDGERLHMNRTTCGFPKNLIRRAIADLENNLKSELPESENLGPLPMAAHLEDDAPVEEDFDA